MGRTREKEVKTRMTSSSLDKVKYASAVLKEYPHATDGLELRWCKRCKKNIKIVNIEPNIEANQAEGMHIFFVDEFQERVLRGYVCWECADEYAKYLKSQDCEVITSFSGLGSGVEMIYWGKSK